MRRLLQAAMVGTGILLTVLGTVADLGYIIGDSRYSRVAARSTYNPPTVVRSAPGNRSQGGRRTIDNACPTEEDKVTALVPEIAGNVWGYTVSDRPTLWFYIPFGKDQFPALSFKLRLHEEVANSDSVRSVLEKPISNRPDSPDLMVVQIPANLVQTGNWYQWSFQFMCNGKEVDGPTGWVYRTAKPSALAQVEKLPPAAQADRYIQEKIWYDALTVLGNQRRANPNDQAASNYWNSLLKDIELEVLPDGRVREKQK